MIRKALIFSLLTVVATLLGVSCVTDPEPEPAVALVRVGDTLPRFSVTDMEGRVVTDRIYAGRRWVLTFFTTTCPDCRRALPELQAFHEASPATPVECIARSESQASVAAYWAEQTLTLSYAIDPEAAVYHLFATAGVPRIYVVDEHGVVIAAYDDTSIPTVAELAELAAPTE